MLSKWKKGLQPSMRRSDDAFSVFFLKLCVSEAGACGVSTAKVFKWRSLRS